MRERFEVQDWVDYVRGLCPPERAQAMAEQAAADSELAREVAALARFAEAARQEREDETPELWIARAQSLLPVTPRTDFVEKLATLLRDSRTAPALGLRGGGGAPLELTYKADRYGVDLRVLADADDGTVQLIGAVYAATDAEPAGVPAGLAVTARSKTRTLSPTDAYGEFEVRVPARSDVELLVTPEGDQVRIRLPLGAMLGL